MVHEIKKKSNWNLLKQSAKEIGLKTIASYGLLAAFFFVIVVTFILTQQRQTILQHAAGSAPAPYTYSFDGNPASPVSMYYLPDFDVQVQTRNMYNDPYTIETTIGQHGSDCSAPPATHDITRPEDTVYSCKNHLMTAIHDGGYGVVYLTPDRMLDWSDGEAVFGFDVSTEDHGARDWWDITISPFMDSQALPLLSDLSQGTDLQGPNKNAIVVTTDNGEGGPNLKVVTNSVVTCPSKGGDCSTFAFNTLATEGIAPGTDQAMTRQPFRLTVSKNHVKFERLATATGTNVVFFDTDMPELSWTRGIIQVGHHSYNPRKDDIIENTWHWDNFYLSDSVPFTIIRSTPRIIQNNGIFTFQQPAPANSYLRFAAVGKIKINGKDVQPLVFSGKDEHFSSYLVPIPEGTSQVQYEGTGDWYGPSAMKDASIFSETVDGIVQPTATPTNIPTPTATPTPIPNGTVIKMGDSTIRTEADNGNGNLLLAQKATLTNEATLQSLSFYVTNASGNLRLGVYNATGPSGGPGQKIAETGSFVPVNGWNTQNVISPVTLNPGTYWLSYLPSDNNLAFVKNSNGTGGKFYSYNYGPMPTTFSTSPDSTSSNWSFYATLITGTQTTTPSPTPTLKPTSTPTMTPTPTPKPTATPTSIPLSTSTPVPTATPTSVGGTPGLTGNYFNNTGLSLFALSRIDPSINFNWGSGSPAPSIDPDTFSAVWSGSLIVPTTNTYTLYSRSDDGVRLYIDNNLVINNWSLHSLKENSKKLSLSAGIHKIKLQYFENYGQAVIQLLWSSPSIPKQIIPSSNLRNQ